MIERYAPKEYRQGLCLDDEGEFVRYSDYAAAEARIAALEAQLAEAKAEQAAALTDLEAENARLRDRLAEALKALEWKPIETAPFNRTVDLWCTYPDAPATWGNGVPAGEIVHGLHGWFGNRGNDGIPQADGPDLIPVAWRDPAPRIPIEMMEAFVAARRVREGGKVE